MRSDELGVMEKELTVAYKSKKFAIRTVKLYKYLCEEKKEYVLFPQKRSRTN